jgi:hypothetical protein
MADRQIRIKGSNDLQLRSFRLIIAQKDIQAFAFD